MFKDKKNGRTQQKDLVIEISQSKLVRLRTCWQYSLKWVVVAGKTSTKNKLPFWWGLEHADNIP